MASPGSGKAGARFGALGLIVDGRVDIAVDEVGDGLDGPRDLEVRRWFFRSDKSEMLVTPSLSWMA